MLRFRWITFDRFKVVNLSRFYRVNFIRPYWVNFTVFSIKELHAHFSQKKALALLYKLENLTRELVAVGERIRVLTHEFKQRW